VHRIDNAAGLWRAIEEMFANQSEARVSNLLIAIANTKRQQFNNSSDYFTKMQCFADELAAALAALSLTRSWLLIFLLALAKAMIRWLLPLAW
jgi:hypothetical protein